MPIYGPLMLDIEGTALTDKDKSLIASPLVGGLILFSRNIDNPQQVLQLTQSIRQIKPNIIIAVDQEGGRVQRLKDGFSVIPPMACLGQLYQTQPQQALTYSAQIAEIIAREVQSVGCDISFTPVLDLGWSGSQIIGDRAFSTDPEQVTHIAESFIEGLEKGGMSATGKHFPGHGSVVADSHVDIPYDDRSLSEIESRDLQPFKTLASKLGGVMPAHIIYSKVDDKAAGFSSFWLQNILRNKCNFSGVIFSDDLSMKGAEVAGTFSERAHQALEAGCDMVLVCNDRPAAIEVLKSLANTEINQASSQRIGRLAMNNEPVGIDALKQSSHWQNLSQALEIFKNLIGQNN
jgi:beta-N-acetylhexosaminidase